MACGNSCLAELGRDFTRLFFAAHAVNDNMAEPFRPFEVAAAAAGGLTIAYGRDHPTVIQWRSSVEHELRRHELDAAQPRPSMDD